MAFWLLADNLYYLKLIPVSLILSMMRVNWNSYVYMGIILFISYFESKIRNFLLFL